MPEEKSVSVVVPVSGDSALFRECLTSILSSDLLPREVLVVDDSPGGIAPGDLPAIVKVVRSGGVCGPARARNRGAREASGTVLAFVDSDVIVQADTLSLLVRAMESDFATGVMAVQSPRMRFRNFSSAYKNLFMRYSYGRLKGGVPLFYTCCVAVRREAFLSAGGFDEGYRKPSVEDTDMGHRLAAVGARLVVGEGIEVEHAKRYTLLGLIRLDFKRAAHLVRLLLRRRGRAMGRCLSVPKGFIASGLFSLGLLLSPLLLLFRPLRDCAMLYAFLYGGIILCNLGLLGAVRKHGGGGLAVRAGLFLPIELLVSAAGALWGGITFLAGRRY